MAINFICRCGKKLCLSDALAGQKLMCPACKRWSIVPDPKQVVQLTPVEELAEPMMVTTIEDPGAPVVAEKTQHRPLQEDEDDGGAYGLNSEDAQLESRLRGGPSADNLQFAGELGCFHISRDDERVQCVAYAADERQALAALGRTVYVLDMKKGKKVGKFREHEAPVTALAFSPDGRHALSGDEDAGIALWEVASCGFIKWLDGHRQDITCVEFTPDGKRALSAAGDGRLFLWDLKRGQVTACLKEGTNPINRIVFSRDGRQALSAGEGGSVRLWDLETGQRICSLHGASGALSAAALSTDGESALAARIKNTSSAGMAVWRWNLKTRQPRVCFESPSKHLAEITCISLSPDGERLLSGGFIRAIKERSGPIPMMNLNQPGAGGADLYSAGVDLFGAGILIGTSGGGVRDTFFRMRHVVQVWNVASGHILHTVIGHQGKIASLAFSRGSRRFLSGAADGTVRAWSVT